MSGPVAGGRVQMSDAARAAAVEQLVDTVGHWRALTDEVALTRRWAAEQVDGAAAGEVGLSSAWSWTPGPCERWWRSPVGLLVAATAPLDDGERWVAVPDALPLAGLARPTLYRRMSDGRLPWRPAGPSREVARDVLARGRLARFTPPR